MTLLVDTNVLLDVFTMRQPHYASSSVFLSEVFSGSLKGVCASHCLTTCCYLVNRHSSAADARNAVDKILSHMEVVGLGNSEWRRVQALDLPDFEDGAVAVTAELAQASFIITRNIVDFVTSSVPAMTPDEFIQRFIPPL
jgi:predicted nucleic acid-binding protein